MTVQKPSHENMIELEVRQLLENSFKNKVVHLDARHHGSGRAGAEDLDDLALHQRQGKPSQSKAIVELERAAVLIEYFNMRVQKLSAAAVELRNQNGQLQYQKTERTKQYSAAEAAHRSQILRAETAEAKARLLKKQLGQLETNANQESVGLSRLMKAVEASLSTSLN